MNVNDLTEELHHRADEAGSPAGAGPGSVGRVNAVRHRIQVRRRRRAAAAGAVVICAVATAFAVPSIDFGRESTLPAGGDTAPGFPGHDGGDPLLVYAIGEPGDHEVSVTFTPTDLDFSVTALCVDPEAPDLPASDVPGRGFEVWVAGGNQFIGDACQKAVAPSTSTTFGDGTEENVQGWKDLGLVAGRPVTMLVRLGDPENWPPVDQIRLGIAVYERSGARVSVGDAHLPELITFDGRDYRLAQHRWTGVNGAGGTLDLDVPAADKTPFVVVAGGAFRTEPKDDTARAKLWVDGSKVDESEGWRLSIQALDDLEAHELKLEHTAKEEGTAVLAYYAPVE